MAPKAPPAFQIYPADFLADTAAMTRAEIGSYILALCHCWRTGSLPADRGQLARALRTTPAELDAEWPALAPLFERRGDTLVHPRLEQHRAERAAFARSASERGRRGNAVRWPSDRQRIAKGSPSDRPAIAEGSPKDRYPIANDRSADCSLSLESSTQDEDEESSSLRSELHRESANDRSTTPPASNADPISAPPEACPDSDPSTNGRGKGRKNARKRPALASEPENRPESRPNAFDAATGSAASSAEEPKPKPVFVQIWDEYVELYAARSDGQKPTDERRHFFRLSKLVGKHGADVVRERLRRYFDNPPFILREGARDMDRFYQRFDLLAPDQATTSQAWFRAPTAPSASAASQRLADEARKILGESAAYMGRPPLELEASAESSSAVHSADSSAEPDPTP